MPSTPLIPPAELEAVVHTFYDRVYAHPWIGRFFAVVDQRQQEIKLVRFIQMSWDDRAFALMQAQYLQQEHAHMFIPAALFDLRQELFADALREHGHDPDVIEQFLRFNEMWRPSIVKGSRTDCSDMFTAIVEHPPPSS